MAQPINIAMGPEQAVAEINGHNHAPGGIGQQVPEEGLADGSISTVKIKDGAVATGKLGDKAVTMGKLSDEVQTALRTVSSNKVVGITNYVADGLKILPSIGLKAKVTAGRASVSEMTVQIPDTEVALNARCPGIIAISKDGALLVQDAVLPEPDQYTIAQWRPDGAANVPNYAVGKSPLAVANDLIRSGVINKVDGYVGYAAQGDGSTGYYASANTTGFLTGAAEREVDALYIHRGGTAPAHIVAFGSGVGSWAIYTENNLLKVYHYNTVENVFATPLTLDVGKAYYIALTYSGTTISVYVNGTLFFNTPLAMATSAGTCCVLGVSTGLKNNGIVNFVEYRTKIRPAPQLAQIANRLCMPVRYNAPSANYPLVADADKAVYHEWKLDEETGKPVTDSNTTTPLVGTATGTTIVDSGIGLGKARYFNGTSSDYISFGSYAFGTSFTTIVVANVADASAFRMFLDNRNATQTVGDAFYVDPSGKLGFATGSNSIASVSGVPIGKPCFLGISCNAGLASLYVDSPYVDAMGQIEISTAAGTLYCGRSGEANSAWMKGSIDYILLIPRALPQPEIAQIYGALMKSDQRDIREILPPDSIALGCVRTDSSKMLERDDKSYKYGRRDGAFGGNRKEFCSPGFQYFSGNQILKWDNPFGTRKAKTKYVWAQDANGLNEQSADGVWCVGSTYYGVQEISTQKDRIRVQTCAGGVCFFNNVVQTSGYIGCYAEVID